MKWTTPPPTPAWRKTLWNCGTFGCLPKGTRLWPLRKSAGTWSDLGWPCWRCTQKVPRNLPSCSVLTLDSEGVHWLIEQNSTVFGLCCWNLYVTLRIDPESWQPHFGCSQLWLVHAVVTYRGRLLEACFASVEADFDRYRKRICKVNLPYSGQTIREPKKKDIQNFSHLVQASHRLVKNNELFYVGLGQINENKSGYG